MMGLIHPSYSHAQLRLPRPCVFVQGAGQPHRMVHAPYWTRREVVPTARSVDGAKSRGQNLVSQATVNQALHHFAFVEIVRESKFDCARLVQR